MIVLSACEGWSVRPINYGTPTVLPSRTPIIRTPTAFISAPGSSTPPSVTSTAIASSPTVTSTEPPLTSRPTQTQLATPAVLKIDILGCDTGLDLSHGMGEVTNAYVTIGNFTGADETDLCATLRGLDEGRPHPDKTKCVGALPAKYQVTLKLTVDTTYRQDTPIQVDITSADSLLLRAGEPACTAIGLFLPDVGELGVIQPMP